MYIYIYTVYIYIAFWFICSNPLSSGQSVGQAHVPGHQPLVPQHQVPTPLQLLPRMQVWSCSSDSSSSPVFFFACMHVHEYSLAGRVILIASIDNYMHEVAGSIVFVLYPYVQ